MRQATQRFQQIHLHPRLHTLLWTGLQRGIGRGVAHGFINTDIELLTTAIAIDHAVQLQAPARVVVAVPVAPLETVETLRCIANEVVCTLIPEWMMSIGYWYEHFPQTTDAEVIDLLHQAWRRESAEAGTSGS